MDETITPQEGTNPEPEVVEELIVEETIETPAPPEKTYTRAEWNELHGRATKAEADLKALRASTPTTSPNVEETVLLANGMPEALLVELKAVAAVRKTSLIKAQADPIFVAVKDKFEKDLKRENASLPAARGSGVTKPKKDFKTPGLTRDEHREMVQAMR